MQLEELQQIKDSLSQGVMIHKGKWIEVLEWAIELTKHHERREPLTSLTTSMQIIAEGRKIYDQAMEKIHARND